MSLTDHEQQQYRDRAETLLADAFGADDIMVSEEAEVDHLEDEGGAWVEVRLWVRD